jgi:hypothetical protein
MAKGQCELDRQDWKKWNAYMNKFAAQTPGGLDDLNKARKDLGIPQP